MASFQELADSYAERLTSSYDVRNSGLEILEEINGLVYTQSNRPLSQGDKVKIVELIRTRIHDGMALKGGDNTAYLQMINYMLQQIQVAKK